MEPKIRIRSNERLVGERSLRAEGEAVRPAGL